MKVWRPKTAFAATRDGDWGPLVAEVTSCASVAALDAFWADYLLNRHRDNPESWSNELMAIYNERREELEVMEEGAEMDRQWRETIR